MKEKAIMLEDKFYVLGLAQNYFQRITFKNIHKITTSATATYTAPKVMKKRGPIFKINVSAAAVLSNLKRIEVTYRLTMVAGHGNYVNFICTNCLQTCH